MSAPNRIPPLLRIEKVINALDKPATADAIGKLAYVQTNHAREFINQLIDYGAAHVAGEVKTKRKGRPVALFFKGPGKRTAAPREAAPAITPTMPAPVRDPILSAFMGARA